jgi:dUTP pyrophosphatase
MIVKVKRLDNEVKVPSYAHNGDSGMDLYANEKVLLESLERKAVGTGLVIEVPEGYEAQVRPKSGIALNHGVTVLNTPGTVDSCYRGEVKVIIMNLGREPYLVERGKKIAQLVFAKVEKAKFEEAHELGTTTRNDGGFGSTGL